MEVRQTLSPGGLSAAKNLLNREEGDQNGPAEPVGNHSAKMSIDDKWLASAVTSRKDFWP
jgi:hypothetical protein